MVTFFMNRFFSEGMLYDYVRAMSNSPKMIFLNSDAIPVYMFWGMNKGYINMLNNRLNVW